MDLIWWPVAIVGCLALAACIAAAMLPPRRDRPETLRPLANTRRLTQLPEYTRAARRHLRSSVLVVALLTIAFGAATLASARPTGLPAPGRETAANPPEDIMVCVGGPETDPAVDATLRYFAAAVGEFGTERIGLTSANRRLVPLTRDYQYAAARFAGTAAPLVSPVSYTDYAANIEDVLALCLTGFPDTETDGDTAPRRSLIYVGPGTLGGEAGPTLFTAQQVREMAADAGVQINAITDETITGAESLPAELARATGGQVHHRGDVTAQLSDIRRHPPPADADHNTRAASVETPEVLLAAAASLTVLAVFLSRESGRRYLPLIAAALLLVAVLRPAIGDTAPGLTTIAGEREPSVFLIVDRSVAGTAQADIAAVVERHPGARFALIGFDDRASLDWPLSADAWTLQPIIAAMAPQADETTANAGAANTVLRYQLISAVQQFPKAQNLVYYFGSGAPNSTVPQREFQVPDDAVDGGAVVGYGPAGAARLRAVADQIGVEYLQRERTPALDEAIADAGERSSAETAPAGRGLELYWVLSGPAAVIILLELYRALGRLRRIHFDRIAVGR